MTTRRFEVAIDIEAPGCRLHDPPIAIGVCVARDGVIIDQRVFCSIVPPEEDFEPRCLEEFWREKDELLARIDANALGDTADMLRAFLNYLGKMVNEQGGALPTFISDNPAFDIGAIDRAIALYLPEEEYGLRHMWPQYCWIEDGSEQKEGLLPIEIDWVRAQCTVDHDHWPVNDATHHWQMWNAIKRVKAMRVKSN